MRPFRIVTIAALLALIVGTVQSVNMAGAMNRLTITTTPTYLSFNNTIVGTTSPTQTVKITNTGSTSVTLGILAITTTTATDEFVLRGAYQCNGKTLAPTETCSFKVAFRPTSVAYKTGTVSIPHSDSATPMIISLTGYGISGTNLLQAPNFDFPIPKPIPWRTAPIKISLNKMLDCSVSFSLYCSVMIKGNYHNLEQSVTQGIGRIGIIGDRYLFRLSSKARKVPAGGQYKVEVQLWNMYNKVVGTKVINFTPGTHEFETVKGIITANAQYSWVIFRFTYKNPSGIAWFDNAAVILLP